MTEPVQAAAEAFEVDNLVRAIADLESRGRSIPKRHAVATGLDKPRYVVDIDRRRQDAHAQRRRQDRGRRHRLRRAKDKAARRRSSPPTCSSSSRSRPADYRDKKLVDVTTGDVRQITLEKPERQGRRLAQRHGGDWKITEPKAMPAEKTEVDDILFAPDRPARRRVRQRGRRGRGDVRA